MSLPLPPLGALRLFEAVGRLQSVRLAADELHLTPSAVSHGIQTLAEWLGFSLCRKTSSGIRLTPLGEEYHTEISKALQRFASAIENVGIQSYSDDLHVSVAPSFGSMWLLPRIARFTENNPTLNVVITTEREAVVLNEDVCALAIRISETPGPENRWMKIAPLRHIPVCSPANALLLRSLPEEKRLSHLPLIHVTTLSEGWEDWRSAVSFGGTVGTRHIYVDTSQMAADIALDGGGVALAHFPLIGDALRSGRLVSLDLPECTGRASYWLISSDFGHSQPAAQLFESWLQSEIRDNKEKDILTGSV